MVKNKFKKQLNTALRVLILLTICTAIVLLLPKASSFSYEYQLGASWRYEQLNAPFDFPVYKDENELFKEREKIKQNQIPIFNIKENVKTSQCSKFTSAVDKYATNENIGEIELLLKKFENIYNAGIFQLPEKMDSSNVSTIKIVQNNIGKDVNLKKLYTLKQAYTTLTAYIHEMEVPSYTQEALLNLNLSQYLQVNLEFDVQKTGLEQTEQLLAISETQGMIHAGELIINKNEIVTPEKYKILNSLKQEYRHNTGNITAHIRVVAGLVILTLAAMLVFSIYFYFHKKRIFFDNKEFIFLFGSFLAIVALASISYHQNINILAIPILFFVIIVNTLIGRKSAIYLLLGSMLLASYFAPNSYMFLFMQLTAGIVTVYSLSQLQRRGQLFLAIFFIFIAYIAVYISFIFIQEGELRLSHLPDMLWLLANCLLLSLSYPVIYLFERVFGFTSEITLMELSNPNHPLLRNLTKKAPGTFQHSLMVANLAEEAIYRIGGNPLLVRTGALYHDIGKSLEPFYFIENQAGGFNPHSELEFDESAQHIIKHVTAGIEIAKKHKLPEVVIDFIRTHHGKSKAKFFYNSYKNKYPDKTIDEEIFTYPGPDPMTKECAVLMMADAVEAASRTLADKSEENIRKFVSMIIDSQVDDGRFRNADITFKDIAAVKNVFTDMLINIYHARIVYPKLDKQEKTEKEEDHSPKIH